MLPNWLYGKSLKKLQEIFSDGSTPPDYDQVKAQVTQNTENITLLNSAVAAKVDWNDYSELGAVNYCKNNATTTTTTDGTTTFTWTVNDDKSVSVSAPSYPVTLASNQNLVIWNSVSAEESKVLVNKAWRLTGCPNSDCVIELFRVGTADGSGGSLSDRGEGLVFTWLNNASGTKVAITLGVKSGATLTEAITFKPMLTPVSYNGPYVPYAMTNAELTKKLTADANLSAAVDLSTYTSYSNLYTAPSDGYVHFVSAASGSTARTIYTYGNNTTAATDPHFTHSTSANNKAFEIFIKKGLKVYIDDLQSGDTINFYPLS